jgi:hypothetical protein
MRLAVMRECAHQNDDEVVLGNRQEGAASGSALLSDLAKSHRSLPPHHREIFTLSRYRTKS